MHASLHLSLEFGNVFLQRKSNGFAEETPRRPKQLWMFVTKSLMCSSGAGENLFPFKPAYRLKTSIELLVQLYVSRKGLKPASCSRR